MAKMSMKDKLVEIAVSAIWSNTEAAAFCLDPDDYEGLSPGAKDDLLDAATAAVEAILSTLREPTPDMCHAGQAEGAAQVRGYYVVGFPTTPVGEFLINGETAIWQVMIDAIETEESK